MTQARKGGSEQVFCVGGPFSGAHVPRSTDSILLTGDGVPEGMVARYRFRKKIGQYSFDGYDKVVATIPRPGAE